MNNVEFLEEIGELENQGVMDLQILCTELNDNEVKMVHVIKNLWKTGIPGGRPWPLNEGTVSRRSGALNGHECLRVYTQDFTVPSEGADKGRKPDKYVDVYWDLVLRAYEVKLVNIGPETIEHPDIFCAVLKWEVNNYVWLDGYDDTVESGSSEFYDELLTGQDGFVADCKALIGQLASFIALITGVSLVYNIYIATKDSGLNHSGGLGTQPILHI